MDSGEPHFRELEPTDPSARCLGPSRSCGRVLWRAPAEPAIGTGGSRLRGAALRAYQSGNANDADSRLPSIGNACDADSCVWTTGRVRVQVLGQHRPDGALSLRVRIGRGVHGQPRHVSAHGAVLFSFKDDWVEHCHSTPASPSLPAPSSFFVTPPRLPCRSWGASAASGCPSLTGPRRTPRPAACESPRPRSPSKHKPTARFSQCAERVPDGFDSCLR